MGREDSFAGIADGPLQSGSVGELRRMAGCPNFTGWYARRLGHCIRSRRI